MTRKLPWATAAVIIVAAVAIGTWAILGAPPAVVDEEPTPEYGWGSPILGYQAGQGGIVAVYIAKEGTDFTTSPSTWTTDNYHYKFTADAQTGTIPYETNFAIVIHAAGEDMAYLVRENIRVNLTAENTSWPALYIDNESITSTGFSWYEVFGTDNIEVSAVWDNSASYYKIPADGGFQWSVSVWLWR